MAVVLLAAIGCPGCEFLQRVFSFHTPYLLYGYDQLALPGQPTPLQARLQKGSVLADQHGQTIRFYRGEELVATAVTGHEGIATAWFTPPSPGDYFFQARIDSDENGESSAPATFLIACRPSEAPLAFVDLDKTLLGDNFWIVLTGDPKPYPDSMRVLKRLAETHTIVYQTFRMEHFDRATRGWLHRHDFPHGPMMGTTFSGVLRGNLAFRTDQLRQIRMRFSNLDIGVGDKMSDIRAYHDAGMQTYLILNTGNLSQPRTFDDTADELAALPKDVQVLTDWSQLEHAIFQGGGYPVSDAIAKLRRRAAELRREFLARR